MHIFSLREKILSKDLRLKGIAVSEITGDDLMLTWKEENRIDW